MEMKNISGSLDGDKLKRLAHVGRLAAGIGHNIMTPLSLIMMNGDLLTMKVNGREDLLKHITEITEQAAQISKFAEALMWKVSIEQQETPSTLQVGSLVERNLQFWMGDMFFKHRLEKEFQIDTQTPPLKGIPYHFTAFMDEWIMGIIARGGEQERGSFRAVVECLGEDTFYLLFEDAFIPPGEEAVKELEAHASGAGVSPIVYPALQRLLHHHPAEVVFTMGDQEGAGFSLRLTWRL